MVRPVNLAEKHIILLAMESTKKTSYLIMMQLRRQTLKLTKK